MSHTKSPRLICFSYMLIYTISLHLIIAVSYFTKCDLFFSVTDYDGINKKEETKDLEMSLEIIEICTDVNLKKISEVAAKK